MLNDFNGDILTTSYDQPQPPTVEAKRRVLSPRSSIGSDTRDLQIPMATYYYDQRIASWP